MPKSNKGPFLLAAKRVMHQIEHILKSSGVQWQPGAPYDMRPYINAMQRLCEDRHVVDQPIDHLRRVASVMDALHGSVGGEDLKAGEKNARQYEQWLSSAFPEAFDEMRREASERTRKQALN
jgi:hypothetical protein